MSDEAPSRRLKRWGWACADLAFHISFTLVIVTLSFLETIYDECAKTVREWREP